MDFAEGTGASVTASSQLIGTLASNSTWAPVDALGAYSVAMQEDAVALAFPAPLATLTASFTVQFWVLPTAAHELDAPATEGTAGSTGQKFVFAPCTPPAGHVCLAISVGTNGVSVYQFSEALGVFSPLLVVPVTIAAWTVVTVAVTQNQPAVRCV